MRIVGIAVLGCLALAGCDREPAFDASSLPAYQKSLAEIRARLNDQDKRRLDIALITVADGTAADTLQASSKASIAVLSALDGVANPLIYLDRLRPTIEGRSAAKVIALVAADLDFAIGRAEAQSPADSNALLGAIEISNPRYYWNRGKYADQAAIEFSVFNGSKVPIAGLSVSGVLTTRGRAAPLATGGLQVTFPRTLQPGGREQAKYTAQNGTPWANKALETAYDADLALKVANIADATGKRLLTTDTNIVELMRKKRDALRGS